MMSTRLPVISLLLVLTSSAALAQPVRFERITVDHGLSGNWVQAIIQDREGFLWIGTQEGLNRFDGYGFEVFTYRPGDPTSLSDNAITTFLEDRDGHLWVGTNHGLNRFDRATQSFTRLELTSGLRHAIIRALYEDRGGDMWVGTDRGLYRWNPSDGTFIHYPEVGAAATADETVMAILEDSTGRIWVGTQPGGLARLDREAGAYRRVEDWGEGGSAHLSAVIALLHEDAAGRIWIATWDDPPLREGAGLHRYDPDSGAVESFYYTGPEGSDLRLNLSAINENDDGTFWLTAFGGPATGLHLFDPETGTFLSRHGYVAHDPASLTWGYATALYHDRSGIMWVGTSRGLNMFDPGRIKFGHFKEILDDPYDLSDNVYPIHQDADGILWLGIDGPGGLIELDRRTSRITRHVIAEARTGSTDGHSVFALADIGDESLWLGTTNGLFRFDRRTTGLRVYRHDPTDPGSLPHNSVTSLMSDRDGLLWVGTEDGLARFDPAQGIFLSGHDDAARALGGTKVRTLYQDRAGVIWVGTNIHINDASGLGAEGLIRLDPHTGEARRFAHDPDDPSSLSNNGVNVIYEDATGTLWVGTDNGLNRYDAAAGTFRYYLKAHGLPSAVVLGILEDDAGSLWLSTRGGLSRFDPTAGTLKNFGLEDGIQNKRFNVNSYFRSSSGELFFGGPSGLNYFFPDRITENPEIPPVVLTAFRLRDGGSGPAGALSDLDEIVLRHRENAFSFEFAALSFRAPHRNQFAYKLEGFDRDWVQAGTQRAASYTNLSPGRYTFRVRGSNNDGVWNEDGASIRVRVLPPWWRTWWAYGCYAMLFVGGIFGVDRFQRRRLVQKERERARERELEQAREIERAYEELKRTQAQLVQQEKLASLGQLTAGIAHEIKNPLNFVNNFSDLSTELIEELRAEIESVEAKLDEAERAQVADILGDLKQNLTKIAEHGRRADGIVRSMLEHSRGGKGERQSVDVNALVEEYVNLAYHGKRAQNGEVDVRIERQYAPEAGDFEVVPQDFGRVIVNLVGNAWDAVAEGAAAEADGYQPAVRVSTIRNDSTVEIRVSDNGPGIPEELRERIFEPFFTTKAAGSGTGLGLSLSYEIITQGHGGALTVVSEPGQGSEFVVRLPGGNQPSQT